MSMKSFFARRLKDPKSREVLSKIAKPRPRQIMRTLDDTKKSKSFIGDESVDFDPSEVRKPDRNELTQIMSGTLNKGGVPAKPVKTTKVTKGPEDGAMPMPAVHTKGTDPLVEKIYQHAEKERSPKYSTEVENPMFGPADPELTKSLIPQRSIQHLLPPKPGRNDRLPANDRSRFIMENEDLIAQRLVRHLQDSEARGIKPLPFYSTGSVITGLEDKGRLTRPQSLQFMRDWAGQGAATSPRTATPQNLRNSSLLMYRNAQGDRLTPEMQRFEQEQGAFGFPKDHNSRVTKSGEAPSANLNRPGFAMMEMHSDLGNKFWEDTVDPWNNPKPYTFRENWFGNMSDVTADTHNIRAVLDAYDEMNPGTIPREWFKTDDAYRRYREGGGFPQEGMLPVGDIEDGLKGQKINGRNAQTEYPIIQGPTKRAAEMMNISPAEAQERLWFDRGHRTGLQSPRMAIPDLLNSQIEATAKATGLAPEVILRLWAQRKIPLAQNEPAPGAPQNSIA